MGVTSSLDSLAFWNEKQKRRKTMTSAINMITKKKKKLDALTHTHNRARPHNLAFWNKKQKWREKQ